VIGEAGRHDLNQEELLRLQRIIIADDRFVKLGFRTQGGFVGQHDRQTQMPLPDHISARPEDIDALIKGLFDFDLGPGRKLDPVLAAAVLAFGFIYIHPFEDGNGRIHRYIIHHVLAQKGFTPRDAVFPISAVIMERIVEYRRVLEDYSRRLLPVVQWTTTQKNNVRVLNDTADFYRFFDATPQAEFLYDCVRKTIEEDLPREADFLRRHDAFQARVKALVDMPDRLYDLLFRFLQQNNGSLSQRARQKEFSRLTEQEVQYIEQVYNDLMSMD
jgi:Fic family protein